MNQLQVIKYTTDEGREICGLLIATTIEHFYIMPSELLVLPNINCHQTLFLVNAMRASGDWFIEVPVRSDAVINPLVINSINSTSEEK